MTIHHLGEGRLLCNFFPWRPFCPWRDTQGFNLETAKEVAAKMQDTQKQTFPHPKQPPPKLTLVVSRQRSQKPTYLFPFESFVRFCGQS
jgi:hypothetical protein